MKHISLDACIHQPTEHISDPPTFILCDESTWPANYSSYSQGQILPPNPMCAFMTQHMWSLPTQHKDGGYSAQLLNLKISDREHWLYIVVIGSVLPIILEHGTNFNSHTFGLFPSHVLKYKTRCFTNTFSPCLQACYSQNKYHCIIICTVLKHGLKSIY